MSELSCRPRPREGTCHRGGRRVRGSSCRLQRDGMSQRRVSWSGSAQTHGQSAKVEGQQAFELARLRSPLTRVLRHCPLAQSHSLIVLSREPVAAKLPTCFASPERAEGAYECGRSAEESQFDSRATENVQQCPQAREWLRKLRQAQRRRPRQRARVL